LRPQTPHAQQLQQPLLIRQLVRCCRQHLLAAVLQLPPPLLPLLRLPAASFGTPQGAA
jgi:hypothetical protein